MKYVYSLLIALWMSVSLFAVDSEIDAARSAAGSHTVKIVSSHTTRGAVFGGGTYSASSVTIGAAPFSGYVFSHWSDGGLGAARSINLTSDTTLTAYFVKEKSADGYFVSSYDPASGSIEVQLTAVPAQGFSFQYWANDGNTDNPRIVSGATGNYEAFFSSTPTGNHDDPIELVAPRKQIVDGQLIIQRDGHSYTATGHEL